MLEGVRNDFADPEALERECLQGRAMIINGKIPVHLAQIAIADSVRSPGKTAPDSPLDDGDMSAR